MPADVPTHRLVQFSDLHLTDGNSPLFGSHGTDGGLPTTGLDTDAQLRLAFARITNSGQRFDAVIISGDLADDGSPEAYRRLGRILAEQAEVLGCPILVGAGNHDRREHLNHALANADRPDAALDSVTLVRGLRIVQLDSSVPGAGHGELSRGQLDWLAGVLITPAPHGTVLVVHHPPVPTSSLVMASVALRNRDDLAKVLAGSDVRIILSGHMHAAGQSALAGIPVAICGAVSYAADALYDHVGFRGTAKGQSFAIVEVFEEQVMTTVVPVAAHPTIHQIDATRLAQLGP